VGFFNQQLGMKIYKRLLMIIELSTFFHIWNSHFQKHNFPTSQHS
jgi:hypothetical protein